MRWRHPEFVLVKFLVCEPLHRGLVKHSITYDILRHTGTQTNDLLEVHNQVVPLHLILINCQKLIIIWIFNFSHCFMLE